MAQARMGRTAHTCPMPKIPKPEQMTPEERNREVAAHFARAFLRSRIPSPPAIAPGHSQPSSTAIELCKPN